MRRSNLPQSFSFKRSTHTNAPPPSRQPSSLTCSRQSPKAHKPRETLPRAAKLPSAAYEYSATTDRKSTRLNSSHDQISYAVFCLKKKNQQNIAPYGRWRVFTLVRRRPPSTCPAPLSTPHATDCPNCSGMHATAAARLVPALVGWR